MNSLDSRNTVISTNEESTLIAGISWFYSQFIQGDIDEQEFSDLIDLQIELGRSAAA